MIPQSHFGNKIIYFNKNHELVTNLELVKGAKVKYQYSIPFINCIKHQQFIFLLTNVILKDDIDTKYKEQAIDEILDFAKIKKEHKELVLKEFIEINTHKSQIPSLKEQDRTFEFDIDSFVSIAHFIASKDNDTSNNVLKRPYVEVMHLLDILMLNMLKEEYSNNEHYLSMDNTKSQNEIEKIERTIKIRNRQMELDIILGTSKKELQEAKIKADTEVFVSVY